MNDSTIALAMEIVPFSISVFVKVAFTGSIAPLVSTSLPFSVKWLIKVNGAKDPNGQSFYPGFISVKHI